MSGDPPWWWPGQPPLHSDLPFRIATPVTPALSDADIDRIAGRRHASLPIRTSGFDAAGSGSGVCIAITERSCGALMIDYGTETRRIWFERVFWDDFDRAHTAFQAFVDRRVADGDEQQAYQGWQSFRAGWEAHANVT